MEKKGLFATFTMHELLDELDEIDNREDDYNQREASTTSYQGYDF